MNTYILHTGKLLRRLLPEFCTLQRENFRQIKLGCVHKIWHEDAMNPKQLRIFSPINSMVSSIFYFSYTILWITSSHSAFIIESHSNFITSFGQLFPTWINFCYWIKRKWGWFLSTNINNRSNRCFKILHSGIWRAPKLAKTYLHCWQM